MKNVIAYSLWGEKPMYWFGAQKNIELADKFYPGWVCRFYIEEGTNVDLINMLQGNNVEIVMVSKSSLSDTTNWQPNSHQGMFWRFWAAEDPNVDVFLSRDCDSRLSERESLAVQEWLNSDKDFHIMRDHPYHTTPILGGMWGCRNQLMIKIKLFDMIKKWISLRNNNYNFGVDQDFLSNVLYSMIRPICMEHSEFGISFGGQIKPFPTKRINFEYVGDIFDENDQRHPEYWKIIEKITK